MPDKADDFCEDALQQKQVKLPDSCLQHGRNTTVYEVGDCANKPCRLDSDNGGETCSDSSNSCCIPSRFETKSIYCSDQVVKLTVVKGCSCGSCSTTWSDTVRVSGKVISVKSGSPVQHAEVLLNGRFETHTRNTGNFYIDTVDNTIGKVVITIKDSYNNMHLDTTKVVEVARGMGGSISVTIQMIKIADPVNIDSSTGAVFSLGNSQNDSSSPVALLNVPANSFYRTDGKAYTGMVSSFVTFLDPTDDSIKDAIPGVFQTIDEEGSNVDLESKGMFNIQFQSELGEDLYMDGIIEVSFPDQNTEDFTLWKLNPVSGLWESLTPNFQTARRKRRQINNAIGGIDFSVISRQTFCNIDRVYRLVRSWGRWCYLKVRVYNDDSLVEQLINYYHGYRYMYIHFRRIQRNTLVGYSTYVYFWSSPTYCIKVPCGGFIGYIALDTHYWYDQKLIAAQPKTTNNVLTEVVLRNNSNIIGVSMIGSHYGPLYWSRYVCRASDASQSHFPFYKVLSSADRQSMTLIHLQIIQLPTLVVALLHLWA